MTTADEAIAQPLLFEEVSSADRLVFELTTPVPKNYNWYMTRGAREAGAHQAVWEPLFVLDYAKDVYWQDEGAEDEKPEGNLVPWLGLSITPDTTQKLWTLKLRPDVFWSDSRRFTSADVKFTADMVNRTPEFNAVEAVNFRAQHVEQVSTPDDWTVIFQLRDANPRFALETFGNPMFGSFLIMPKHIWQDKDADKFAPDVPIGTGPYTLKAADGQAFQHVVWERDPDWWGAKVDQQTQQIAFRPLPEPLELEWLYTNDEQESIDLLTADKLDASRPLSVDAFTVAKEANAGIIGWTPSESGLPAWNDPCPRQLEVNTLDPVWSDSRLRKAASLLIDRKLLAETAYQGTTSPSATMFADYGAMRPYIKAVADAQPSLSLPLQGRPDLAEPLFNEAGFIRNGEFFSKDGRNLSVAILVNADAPGDFAGASAVATQLVAAGIDAKVDAVSNDDYWGHRIPEGDFEMAYGWLACGSVAEPYTSMHRYSIDYFAELGHRSPGFNNTGRWKSQPYSDIVDEIGRRALDDTGIPGLVAQAYAILDAETPVIPLVQSPRIIAFNTSHWTGWPTATQCVPPDPNSAAQDGPDKTEEEEPRDSPICTVPMHSWGSAGQIIFNLQRAQ